MILLEGVRKIYDTADGPLTVLDIESLQFEEGRSYALVGPSGSGKSTLLALLAGLERPSTGAIVVSGEKLNELKEDQLAGLRNRTLGYVFQSYQLLENLTALENVMVPAELLKSPDAENRAIELLDAVGLSQRASHFPSQLSGGEQQRVALARAFVNTPKLILADEPTGNLDGANAERVQKLLLALNAERETTLIVATHDLDFASKLGTQIRLRSGRVQA